ncbi:MAG: lipopolysaccharide biosynthesis protein [Akkermansiaceae bacterium]
MKAYFERVARNTGLGLISGVVILFAGVTRAILLGRFFDLSTFGYFVICINLVAFAKILLQVGLADTILRFYPEYETKERPEALSSLVLLGAYLSALVTLLVVLSAWLFSPAIAAYWYDQPDLAGPILWIALLSGGFMFSNTATAILRVQNKFHLAIIFPSIGACLGPLLIFIFHIRDQLTLSNAVLAVGLGEGIGIVGSTVVAGIQIRKKLSFSKAILKLEPLRAEAREIKSTLTQTSLFGILQSSTQIGGILLLGVLGTPAQVAVLGMATQLSRPLNLVQSSVGSAVSPEITRMHAEGKLTILHCFITRYVRTASVLLALGLLMAWMLAPPAISFFLMPEYLEVVPVFLIFLASSGLVMTFQPFLPVAIARGEVRRRNVVVCFRFVYLGIACLMGLSAMGVALSLLAGNLTIRLLNDLPLWGRVRKASLAASKIPS